MTIKIMKTKWILIICAIVLVGFLIFSGLRACNLYDKNSVLKGQAIELVKQLNNQKQLLTESKKVNAELQVEMSDIISLAIAEMASSSEAIDTLNGRIGQLREARAKLTDPEPIILNLENQIETKDKIISNLKFIITKKDEQIFSLTKKHISERDLRIDTEKALEQANKVIRVGNLRIKGLEKKLRGIRFIGNVKTGAVVALAAAVVYGLVAK